MILLDTFPCGTPDAHCDGAGNFEQNRLLIREEVK